MENSSIKPVTLELLQEARLAQKTWLSDLTEAERNTPGTLQHWAAKDTLIHIIFWVQRATERLVYAARAEEWPHYDDFLRTNDEVFTAQQVRAWAAVLTDVDQAYHELVAQVQGCAEEVLTDPDRFVWQKGQPLLTVVVGNGYSHPLTHLAQFYFERGELLRANQMQEKMAERLSAVPHARDGARYNLACYYATTGQKARALAELGESLRLNPKLIEWSKQDTDLDSLREDPAYQALYA